MNLEKYQFIAVNEDYNNYIEEYNIKIEEVKELNENIKIYQKKNEELENNIKIYQKKENYNKSRNKGPFSSYFTGKFNIFNSFNYSKTLDFEIKNSSRRNYQSLYDKEKKNINNKLTQKINIKNNFIKN